MQLPASGLALMWRYFWVAGTSLDRFTQIESEAIDVGGSIDAFNMQMTALLMDQMATQGEAHIGADTAFQFAEMGFKHMFEGRR